MMQSSESIFEQFPGTVFSRAELSEALCLDDRSARRYIHTLRRAGVPIVPVEGGGYKLAETDDEKRELLHLYAGRMRDEYFTYLRICRSLQIDGQQQIAEILRSGDDG